MSIYTWNDFKREGIYKDLIAFFNYDLFKKENKDIIIFVSRKAYCLFLLLKKKGVIQDGGHEIYSDRYVMKCLDSFALKTNTIRLVDDTVCTGQHMREVIEMLKVRTGITKIEKYIFMKNKEYERQAAQEKEEDETSCKVKIKAEAKDFYRFSAIETLLMHQENIPYMIELPNLCEIGKEDYYIELTSEEYSKLIHQEGVWKYHIGEQKGYEQNDVDNDVIVRDKHIIVNQLENLIFSFSIRVQVNKVKDECENEKYRLVFLPFAILKSVRFSELLQFFYLIYDGTDYAEKVRNAENRLGEKFPEISYIAIYRAVVFFLSMYLSADFKEYLELILDGDRKIGYYTKNYKYNYEESFIKANEKLGDKNYFNLTTRMIDFQFSKVNMLTSTKLLEYAKQFKNTAFDQKSVSALLIAIINKIKNQPDILCNKCNESIHSKFLTIESIVEIICNIYNDKTYSEIQSMLTLCICNMLSQSKMSNEIFLSQEKSLICRGFRYGENSELLFEVSAKVFYAAVVSYYDMICKKVNSLNIKEERSYRKSVYQYYQNYYRMFVKRFQEFLLSCNLIGDVITMDEMYIYAHIFYEVSEEGLAQSIQNKKFIIEDKKNPYYIGKLQEYIEKSDILCS